MEIKILDSILHDELKPWKQDTSAIKSFTELVRATKAVSPTTNFDLHKQLTALLAGYPALKKWLAIQSSGNNTALQQLVYNVNLPACSTPLTHFYAAVITAETHRLYNTFIQHPANRNTQIDIPFQTGRLLNSLKILIQQIVAELAEREFTTAPSQHSDFIHFALYFLQHKSIQLYFSLQEYFKAHLVQVTTLDDFYTLDLNLPVSRKIELTKTAIPANTEITSIAQSNNMPFSFGIKGDETKLRNLISVLCTQKNLLDAAVIKPDDFMKLLTTKDIRDREYRIKIGCETNLFQYIADKLKHTSPKFTYANFGRCNYFFTKNDHPIKAALLSNSKSNNPVSKKTKEEIEKYFKENDM
ncbi:MAG: DUF6617 family protein [Bacteroidota bacterium]|nr:DUF6617 family protein [Bacteroidota bacterium]